MPYGGPPQRSPAELWSRFADGHEDEGEGEGEDEGDGDKEGDRDGDGDGDGDGEGEGEGEGDGGSDGDGASEDNDNNGADHETDLRPLSEKQSLENVGAKRSLTVTIATVYTTVTTTREPEKPPSSELRDYHKATAIDW